MFGKKRAVMHTKKYTKAIKIALIAAAMGLGHVGQADVDAYGAVCDGQGGEGAVSDDAVVKPADADAAGMAHDVAVGDGDLLTDGIFIQRQ